MTEAMVIAKIVTEEEGEAGMATAREAAAMATVIGTEAEAEAEAGMATAKAVVAMVIGTEGMAREEAMVIGTEVAIVTATEATVVVATSPVFLLSLELLAQRRMTSHQRTHCCLVKGVSEYNGVF